MNNFMGEFKATNVKGEILVKCYYETIMNGFDYKFKPIYKIGSDIIKFDPETFMKHKKAHDYHLEGKKIDFKIDNSWNKGFRELKTINNNNLTLEDHLKAFFFYQVHKNCNKLKKYHIELSDNIKDKKVLEESSFKERAKLAQLILNNEMNKEDVKLIKDTVLTLAI